VEHGGHTALPAPCGGTQADPNLSCNAAGGTKGLDGLARAEGTAFPRISWREADIEHKKNRALLPGVCRQKMNRAINA
jgi:hypothetical protein